MLDKAQLDQGKLWKIVQKIRKSVPSIHFDAKCDVVIRKDYIKDNLDYLSETLKLNVSSIPQENISPQLLQTAGEVFTYLNYCPPKLLPLIKHFLENETPKNIILSLRNIIKSPQKSVNKSSRKMLMKVMETFKLNEYEKIQKITKGKCYVNGTFGNCTINMDFNEGDLKLLGLIPFHFNLTLVL